MNIYRLLKLNQSIKSHRIKFLGLWLLSVLNKRYLAIQMDPVLACNLRCKMCYFTDDDFVRKNMKGILKEEDLEPIAASIFKRALKLQIGCGAEPTLFKHNAKLISLARSYGVPYISMVTNGNLLTENDINSFAIAGLNEFILSMHGVLRETYENLMDKGDYDKFHQILGLISEQKKISPELKLRINYTFNRDNLHELNNFFNLFGNYDIDIIQLRPIDKIGETTYNNFSLKEVEQDYLKIVRDMQQEALKRKITLLYPSTIIRNEDQSLRVQTANDSSYIKPYTYYYLSPKYSWKDDFDWRTERFADWQKRHSWNTELFKNIFVSRRKLEQINRNMLNYSVDLN
jgi:MoaA/NifB/PqqE/SkfB family radical SAM enzyme